MGINSASYFVFALRNTLCSFWNWKPFLVLSFHVVWALPSSAGSIDNIDNNAISAIPIISAIQVFRLYFTARCTIVQSTVLRLHVVRLSVCPSVRPRVTFLDHQHHDTRSHTVGWKSWKLIAQIISTTPSLFVT